MVDPPLHVRNVLAGIGLVPAPIEVLGHKAELDDEVAREVLRLRLATFSRHSLSNAPSSLPMIIRASEPPMNERRSSCRSFRAFDFMPSSRVKNNVCYS